MLKGYWTTQQLRGGTTHTYPVGVVPEHLMTNRCFCDPEMEAVVSEGGVNWIVTHQDVELEDYD